MPLIIVTGLPSSGKSTSSKLIQKELESRLSKNGIERIVRIVSDTDMIDWEGRDIIYNSISKEKELRSWIRAEAQRYVNLNHIVILDAAAYIKGFRYELYCISKEAKTQYCIVERFLPQEICWKWNQELVEKNEIRDPDVPPVGYSKEIFDLLVMRYEKCDESNRWDSPLFRMVSEDSTINYDELYDIIVNDNPLVPNKSTSLTQTTSTIFKPK